MCLTTCLSQVNVDPEDLIPKLPKPRDLQPFPTTQALVSGCAELGVMLCIPVALGCAQAGPGETRRAHTPP